MGPGSALIFSEVSPTLLLPGPHGEESRTEIDIHVGAGATLAWLPQLVIAAQGCRHRTDVRIALEQGPASCCAKRPCSDGTANNPATCASDSASRWTADHSSTRNSPSAPPPRPGRARPSPPETRSPAHSCSWTPAYLPPPATAMTMPPQWTCQTPAP